MTTVVGRDGFVTVGGNQMLELKSFGLEFNRDLKEDSAQGDTNKTFKVGRLDVKGSLSVWWDPADSTGQEALEDSVLNGTSVALVLFPNGNVTGRTQYTIATAFLTGQSLELPEDEVIPRSFDFTGESVVRATVP